MNSAATDPTPAAAASPDLDASKRYGVVARLLHWTIAVLILVQIGLGWVMVEVLPDNSPIQAKVGSVHVSVGLTILLLVLVRIGVRLIQPAPAMPAALALWERVLAHASHILFYVVMLALPLTGWVLVSLDADPIQFWGLPWPHLPGLGSLLGSPTPRSTREALTHVHVFILIWIVLVNLAVHVGGALKHQFDGVPVLWRMTFFKPRVAAGAIRRS